MLIIRFLHYLLRWHLWISLAAVGATLQTYVVLRQKITIDNLLLLVLIGAATFGTYRLANRLSWLDWHRKTTIKNIWSSLGTETWLAWAICGFCFVQLNTSIQYTIGASGLLSIMYSLPFVRKKDSWLRLRDIPFFKIALIVLIWTLVTVFLPYLNGSFIVPKYQLFLLFLERMLFYFAIAIPFDIRDHASDTQHGLSTLVTYLGKKNAMILSLFALIISALVASIHYFYAYPQYQLGASVLSIYPIVGYLVWRSSNEKNYLLHYFFLDGCIVIQSLWVIAVKFCQ